MARSRKAPAARRTRIRGEGTIYEKVRRWKTSDGTEHTKVMYVAACSEGFVVANGHRRRKRKFFYAATKTEAKDARDRYKNQAGEPIPEELESNETTLSDFAKHFLRVWKARPRRDGKPRSPATLHSYEKTFRLHILPQLGKVRVADLSGDRVKLFYESLEGQVSPSMRARVHVALRVLVGFAREEGILKASPFDTIRSAVPRHKRPPVEPLNESQVAALLKAARGHRIGEAFITLALDSGMRQGELIALRWEDVDFRGRKLHVQKAASEVEGAITIEAPKSGAGRTIAISEATVDALKRRRTLAQREGLAKSELVFPGERGRHLYKSNFLREVWGPIRKAAGVPQARFHDLRHTSATMLMRSGIHPKVVQERLGHSSITLTLDTYSAFLPSMQAGAARAMGSLLGRLSKPAKRSKRALAVHGGTRQSRS